VPTLFTMLRAKHAEVPPQRPAPTSSAGHGKIKPSLLEAQVEGAVTGPIKRARRLKTAPAKPSVIVVGAGLAGLCAAYELKGLGFEVTVFEARDRVGGRVHSLKGFINGKTMEAGGELIGSNHPLWLIYRQHFGLRFTNVKEYENSPIRVGGCTLSFEESKKLTDEMDVMLKRLTDLAETIIDPFEPWMNRNARSLDGQTLTQWLKKAKGSRACKRAIAEQLAADNGIPAHQQSLLGILAMIKGGGLDRYWTDTEVYRCEQGNQTLAECFETQLNMGRQRVFRRSRVQSVSRSTGKVRVKVRGRSKAREADHLILAIPPSVWNTVRFTDPKLQKRLNKPPRMGSNVKYLMRLRRRFWKDFASSPTLSEDGPVDITWETTEAAKDRQGDFGMVAFSGADHATQCGRWGAQARRGRYVKALEIPYPGIGQTIRQDDFFNWPKKAWTLASYYFPRPTEVTTWGPFWKEGWEGWLHFAGEHTSFAFVGYMEGALSSGYRLARRMYDHL
jgi:monoamine oxidase